jgi:hypothetical protein
LLDNDGDVDSFIPDDNEDDGSKVNDDVDLGNAGSMNLVSFPSRLDDEGDTRAFILINFVDDEYEGDGDNDAGIGVDGRINDGDDGDCIRRDIENDESKVDGESRDSGGDG